MAFHIWSCQLQNKKIILNTDNHSLIFILNTKTSKSKRVMYILRPSIFHSILYNIQFKSVHIIGKDNVIADALSRQQWSRFHQVFPEGDVFPTQIPRAFHQLLLNVELSKIKLLLFLHALPKFKLSAFIR